MVTSPSYCLQGAIVTFIEVTRELEPWLYFIVLTLFFDSLDSLTHICMLMNAELIDSNECLVL